jgi:hypothetical protein
MHDTTKAARFPHCDEQPAEHAGGGNSPYVAVSCTISKGMDPGLLRNSIEARATKICNGAPYTLEAYQENSWASGCSDAEGRTAMAYVLCH